MSIMYWLVYNNVDCWVIDVWNLFQLLVSVVSFLLNWLSHAVVFSTYMVVISHSDKDYDITVLH